MESTDRDLVAVRRYLDVLDSGTFDELEPLLAPDFVFRATHLPSEVDRDGYPSFVAEFRRMMPDWRREIRAMVRRNDRVMVDIVARATLTGSYLGIPASGRRVRLVATYAFRVVNDLIAEHEVVVEGRSLIQQLGAVP